MFLNAFYPSNVFDFVRCSSTSSSTQVYEDNISKFLNLSHQPCGGMKRLEFGYNIILLSHDFSSTNVIIAKKHWSFRSFDCNNVA